MVGELEEAATLGDLTLKGRLLYEELGDLYAKMERNLSGISAKAGATKGITLEAVRDLDLDFFELFARSENIAKALEENLSKADKLAPFASDSKKMYDALVKRIKMRAYRQGYDGIALTPGEVHVDRWASILHNDKQKEGMRKIYSDLIQPRINKAMGHKADGTMKMENYDQFEERACDRSTRKLYTQKLQRTCLAFYRRRS